MIVCSCNVLSDTAIRGAAAEHAPQRVSQVYACLGCRAECGRCTANVVAILRERTPDVGCKAAPKLASA